MVNTPAVSTALPRVRVLLGAMSTWQAEVLGELLGPQDGSAVVGTARGVDELIALAVSLQPDVVLLNFDVGSFKALDATRRLRIAVPSARVVLLGIEDAEVYGTAARAAGATAYVPWLAPRPVLVSAVWEAGDSAPQIMRASETAASGKWPEMKSNSLTWGAGQNSNSRVR